MNYRLRNGVIVEKIAHYSSVADKMREANDPANGWYKVVSMPEDMAPELVKVLKADMDDGCICLVAYDASPLMHVGGCFGSEFDVIAEA